MAISPLIDLMAALVCLFYLKGAFATPRPSAGIISSSGNAEIIASMAKNQTSYRSGILLLRSAMPPDPGGVHFKRRTWLSGYAWKAGG